MATNHYAPGVLVPDITVLTEAQWLEKRRNGIGGSDAAKILGISPFVTRKELYWDKINIPHAHDPGEENWIAKEIGHRLESLVIKIFERSNPGWKVFYDRRMFFHPEYPWMLADVDGLVRDPRTGKLYIVEVKTCSVQALDKWGRQGSNQVPPEYEAQGRHYMAVLGIDGVIYICLAGNQKSGYRQAYIMRDHQKEEKLICAEADFWLNYVRKKTEPPVMSGEDAKKVIQALGKHYHRTEDMRELPENMKDDLALIANLNEQISEENKHLACLKSRRDKILATVLDYLKGSNGILSFPDGSTIQVFYQNRKISGIRADQLPYLRLEYPDVYEKFVKTTDAGFWKVKRSENEVRKVG